MRFLFAGLVFALVGGPGLSAEIALAPLFTDHAVLQQGKLVPIWGRADPGEHVSVSFGGQTVGATAGEDGTWVVLLAPLSASAAGADLVAAGKSNTLTRHDVVVGEVWLCSGQSNMEFTLGVQARRGMRLLNGAQEIAAARFPLIRQFEVGREPAAALSDLATGTWVPCSPDTAGNFSAVGYFFARDIHRRLGVPVGVIDSTWGGTPIEAWLSPMALASDPAFAAVRTRWNQASPDYPHKTSWAPAGLFNGMINPLLPYAMRGVLWYQGESNANRAAEYHRLFAAMISAWRAHFAQGDLPFLWVQLANYVPPDDRGGSTWAYLREAQAQALTLPATGMAVTIDIGDPKSIHPANKQEVGRRLALIAKNKVYGLVGDFSGPVFESAERVGAAMRVHFEYADNGLTAAAKPLQSFEIAGADRRFYPAVASIAHDTVLVQSPKVLAPVAVRYAWQNNPEANLYNGAGLPAAPFRSDNW
jgi:sialate O-acetylesterase